VLLASEELQTLLKKEEELKVGKMFGVLIVQDQENAIGYLAAYSGKSVFPNLSHKFVPPVYDVHAQHSFYAQGEKELNAMNRQIEALENDPLYLEMQKIVKTKKQFVEDQLKQGKLELKRTKKDRMVRRNAARTTLSPEDFTVFNKQLTEESLKGQYLYKQMAKELKADLINHQQKLEVFSSKIARLKSERKNKSARLQQQIFDSYQFINKEKETKGLTEIFPNFKEQKPPSGAGDCTAPKLLQYAFSNDLRPVAMGEFWWGPSPKTEVRKHKVFYPACGGRCKPILSHMLKGIEMEDNPFLKAPSPNKEMEIVFEDDFLLIVNKPAEFLSVPGKTISDSVYTRIKKRLPNATGPLIIHRLDMSTSGILVLAKTKEAHKFMQTQFIKRRVKKRYVALLDGRIEEKEGHIDLPLRVDLDDRPRQLVCYEYGKAAKTKWTVVNQVEDKTRVHLFPITGRTHQLRVHMSHPLGLNTPIIGDDLYGQKADRLHLHAEYIEFIHPFSKEKMNFTVQADF
jgi:tRNA pseudouridine32 synthase/23S rRNA pseudouridine746 synthase